MSKKKRDMQASARTLSYFLTTRHGKPTTVQQAAKALRIPADRVSTMASNFHRDGKIMRLSRGVYASLPTPAQAAAAQDGDQELLDMLLKEREHLDAQIEKVRAVIELKQQRKAGGK
jgi:hypothetical protein